MTQTPLTQDFLDQLKSLTAAVENGAAALVRLDQPALDSSAGQASQALDYLAVRELLGRQPASEATSRFVRVGRKGTQLELYDVPAEATDVAVFTGFGKPTEVLALTAVAAVGSKPGHHTVTLTNVPRTTAIVRVEIRRGDGIPIRLGPRLEPS